MVVDHRATTTCGGSGLPPLTGFREIGRLEGGGRAGTEKTCSLRAYLPRLSGAGRERPTGHEKPSGGAGSKGPATWPYKSVESPAAERVFPLEAESIQHAGSPQDPRWPDLNVNVRPLVNRHETLRRERSRQFARVA